MKQMPQIRFRAFVVGWVLACVSSIASARITLPALFADHMVLQRGMEAPIWGTAVAGAQVTIHIADHVVKTKANPQGEWTARLPPLHIGEANALTISADDGSTVQIKDVLIGDVWLCSGQSNMGFLLRQAQNAKQEIENARNPDLRLFQLPRTASVEPTKHVNGKWTMCIPATAEHFSAVGYFFGRDISKAEHVPVGLIQSAWGGKPAEAFVSTEALEADPELRPLLEWKAHRHPAIGPSLASNIFNSMINPLIPYGIKGVIWYQGEGNAPRAQQYRRLFPALIGDWRQRWGEGDFPFLFVQLPNFRARQDEPSESDWAELREAQLLTFKNTPNTGMACTIDIGDARRIHPKDKQDVAKRLVLWAERLAYGKDVEASGPLYESMKVEGNEVKLRFDHAQRLTTAKGGPLTGFAIAGEDHKFVWATARIEGNEVIVSAKGIVSPVAVRYAWADNPECNLINAAGLPASPFRTDDWPLTTAGIQVPGQHRKR